MKELIRRILLEERIKWTKEMIQTIASQYNNKKEFIEKEPKAFYAAYQRGWWNEISEHMQALRNPKGYWTFDKVKNEADKYTSRRDFEKNSIKAFRAAKQHGWYDDVTSHMDYLGSLFRRAVYAWEFSNNTVYIGLTDDTARREGEHLDPEGKTAVSKYIKETNLIPTLKLISDYVDVKDAQNIEKCSIDLYKSLGWNVLNKVKSGGLGACKRIWTKENVEKEAQKYQTRSDFKKGNRSAYVIAVREGWMDDITKHMSYKQTQWNEDMVRQTASKYSKLSDFLRQETKAVAAARRMNIYSDIIKNMERSPFDRTNI
jgi:predicted GIY-YIG superfamily endonuclease